MADGQFPTLVSATRDVNAAANPLFTKLSDGSDTLAINADGSLNVVATATDLDIRDLSHSQDSVKVGDGTDFLAVNADGSINVVATLSNDTLADDSAFTVGTSKVYPMGALADESATDSVDEGDIGAPRMTLDRKLLTRVVGSTDANRLEVDASGRVTVNVNGTVPVSDGGGSLTIDGAVTVSATSLDVRALALATDAVKVSGNSSANSATNPIFVKNVEGVVSSTEVSSYNTAASVASDATSNHDYTVTGSTFMLRSIIAAFSGAGKIEVQVGPVGSLASKAVAFVSQGGGHVQLEFSPAIEVPVASTGTVRIIRTNRQGQAQDVYSTIIGNDLP